MKFTIVIIIAIFILSCHESKVIHTVRDFNAYSVVKIDSINNVYLIYAKRNDSIFKIISIKQQLKSKCHAIKLNGEYEFKLVSLFRRDIGMSIDITPDKAFIGNTWIKLEPGCVQDLYSSDNINGLCIIEGDNTPK